MIFLIISILAIAYFIYRNSQKKKLNKLKNKDLDKYRLPVKNGFARVNLNKTGFYYYKPKTVIAIDVETANEQPFSICSIAIVKIENDAIIDSFHTYIRPLEEYFTNTKIHGITYNMVKEAPTFSEFWRDTLSNYIKSAPLLAHNAEFDISCVLYTLQSQGVDEIDNTIAYIDTLYVAKQTWKNLSNYKLPTICEHLNIQLEHHNALSDTMACAKIYLTAIIENKYRPKVNVVVEENKELFNEFVLCSDDRPFTFRDIAFYAPEGYKEKDFIEDFVTPGKVKDVTKEYVLKNKKVAELKEILTQMGLAPKGRKQELIKLILESNIPFIINEEHRYQSISQK